MMKEGKKCPCEQCAEGTYMNVEEMWWCNKHLMYACGVERNHGLCEKFNKTTSKNDAVSRQVILAIERYQDLVDYFDDEDVAKTILGSREGFKQWLARMKWHVEKADELARKLDQKPCEDAISRKSMLDYLKYLHGDIPEEEFVKALPSVTPAPKKSKWIDNHNGAISCGCCHTWFHKDDRYSYMRYCPNCGAKLEVEE